MPHLRPQPFVSWAKFKNVDADSAPKSSRVVGSKMPPFYKPWVPVVAWMGFIFWMSTDFGSASHTSQVLEPLVYWIKPDATPDQFDFVHFCVRKAAHLSEYAVLGLLVLRAVRLSVFRSERTWSWRVAGLALLICSAYAASDEFHQTFNASRTPSPIDVLIDTCGAGLAIGAASLAARQTSDSRRARI